MKTLRLLALASGVILCTRAQGFAQTPPTPPQSETREEHDAFMRAFLLLGQGDPAPQASDERTKAPTPPARNAPARSTTASTAASAGDRRSTAIQSTPPRSAEIRLTSAVASHFAEPDQTPFAADAQPEPLPANSQSARVAEMLNALPKLSDTPNSLFATPTQNPSNPIRIDAPYFTTDPLLDPPQVPSPGWFGGMELQVVKPHLNNQLAGFVQNRSQIAAGTHSNVMLPNASLDWTTAPRFFAGYRLPSGFGDVLASYRFLDSQGSQGARFGDGAGDINSRFAMNILDFDYNSDEFSGLPNWDMKWTFGNRFMTMYFNTMINQPYSQAAAGSGIFAASAMNQLVGDGPHAAVQLSRRLGSSGLAFTTRTDFSSVFSFEREQFTTYASTLGASGRPLVGVTNLHGNQASPILNVQAGLTYKPPRWTQTSLYMGYTFEQFWALNHVPPVGANPPSQGLFSNQGVVLRLSINF